MEPTVSTHRAVVPRRKVVTQPQAAYVGSPRHAPRDEPRVELVQEDGIIQAIDITCTCGRRLRLHCTYAEPQDE